VVLTQLFEGARSRVVLAGYSFDHAREVLEPLHRVMTVYGVEAYFFVDIEQARKSRVPPELHAQEKLADFRSKNWPFGPPFPSLFYDRRALVPGPPWCSLHAKCVTVDGRRAFISSANFTERGQERNIEVGVLIDDRAFAENLTGQWLGLIDAGLVGEVGS
jgi:phosphatidylserine/phosphatidylglycerophosphate/cardiolipin synthase-like enzyme